MPWMDRFYTESDPRRRLAQGLVVIVLMIGIGLLIFNMFWYGSDMAKRVVCGGYLKELGMAIRMYADDNSGYYPPAERWPVRLVPYVDGLYVFFCPADNQVRPIRRRKKGQLPISYWYKEPLSLATTTYRTPLAGDRMYVNFVGNHKNGGNVLFADEHVAWYTLKQWEEKRLPTESYVDWKNLRKRETMPYSPRPPRLKLPDASEY